MVNNQQVFNRSREDLEKIEDDTLASYAVRSKDATRLYMNNYQPCKRRTEFERDKDRIIYSLAFKRLMEKTQVYVTHEGDHYTNRLSHTLEVTQISRSISSSLGLNAYLAEVIALGHDLGHTPFGHAVESILKNNLSIDDDGFEHNYQSVLVVDVLENKNYKNDEALCGINLTNYTRYGILHHTGTPDNIQAYTFGNDRISVDSTYKSLEAELVNKIDTIAYLYHDLEDAIRNKNILQDMKLNDRRMFDAFLELLNFYTDLSCKINGDSFSGIKDLWDNYNPNIILKAMIKDLIIGTQKQIEEQGIVSLKDVQSSRKPIASFNDFEKHFKNFKKDFVGKYIYQSPLAYQMDTKAKLIASRLFDTFASNPNQLPYRTRNLYQNAKNWEATFKREDSGYRITPKRVIANYIAGMTDRYALVNYKRMFE
ncbi:MAG: dNTP triphosphohydrolase [bacterium]|nr:dNTP triphosphohydrolase [bacterium]